MARIAGIDIPNNKRVEVGLTYIYGIGRKSSMKILDAIKIDKNRKVGELTEQEISTIRKYIEQNMKVEGDLRKEISMNIKRSIVIGDIDIKIICPAEDKKREAMLGQEEGLQGKKA